MIIAQYGSPRDVRCLDCMHDFSIDVLFAYEDISNVSEVYPDNICLRNFEKMDRSQYYDRYNIAINYISHKGNKRWKNTFILWIQKIINLFSLKKMKNTFSYHLMMSGSNN
jgi:hypothetical protein